MPAPAGRAGHQTASSLPGRAEAENVAGQPLPYADGLDRLRLLFLLAAGPGLRDLAIVGQDQGQAEAMAVGWADTCNRVTCTTQPASLEQGSFDAVFMLGAQGPTGRGGFEEGLSAATRALAPGGMLVGYVFQSRSLHGLRARWIAPAPSHASVAGTKALHGALLQAGLESPETYYVEPNIDSPMALVPTQATAAKRHFQRTVERNQPLYGAWGYGVRWLIARLGLGGLLQPQLFYWARRPC